MAVLRLRARPVPLEIHVNVALGRMSLGEVRVEFKRPRHGRPGLGQGFLAIDGAQEGLPRVGFRQTRVRQRVIRRLGNGLLEIIDALVHFRLAADQKIAPLQIQPVRFRVGGVVVRELAFLLAAQLVTQRLRDGCRDLAFDLQHVLRAARIFFTPELRRVMRADELRTDVQAQAMLRQAAQNQGIGAELAGDLHRRELQALQRERGSARDDMQSAQARELVDQALRDAIAQVFVRWIAGRIFKWQYRHHADARATVVFLVKHGRRADQQHRCEHCATPQAAARTARTLRRRQTGLRRTLAGGRLDAWR